MRLYGRETSEQKGQSGSGPTVLFVTNGSDEAQLALDEAIRLAAGRDARLIVLYVVDSRFGRRISHLLRAAIEGERRGARRVVHEAIETARRRGVEARGMVVWGRPGAVVCRVAERHGAELVVMRAGALDSGRGLTDATTSDYVLRHSTRPVCLVGNGWQPPHRVSGSRFQVPMQAKPDLEPGA